MICLLQIDPRLYLHVFCTDDFKPMSMDTSQNATLEIGEGDSVSVVVPNNEVGEYLILSNLKN